MRKSFISSFLFPMLALLVVSPTVLTAQPLLLPECQEDSLPGEDLKFPGNQLILVCIPAQNWNGALVLYAHGFVPPQFDLTLPLEELTLEGTFVPLVFLSQVSPL